MKKIIWIAAAMVAALAVSSCNEIKENMDFSPAEIYFTAGIGNYQTKLTDSAFDTGDEVGLFAGAPLNFVNEKLSWNGSGFTSEHKLLWAENQQEKASFVAYHPFNSELTSLDGALPFYVKTDQKEYKDYTQSDLLLAKTDAGPSDKSVYLPFDHILSKLSVTIKNQSGEAIKEVFFAGLKPGVMIDGASGTLGNVLGDEETYIYAAPFQDGDGNKVYSVIVPPQRANFGVAVKLESGRMVLYTSTAELISGKKFSGTVTLSEMPQGEKVQFSLEMSEWEEGETLRFISGGESSNQPGWRVIYYASEPDGSYQRSELMMEEKAPGEFFLNIPRYFKEDYFILLSTTENYIFGCSLEIPQNIYYSEGCWPVDNGGRFQLNDYEGDLNIWFYPNDGYLKYDPVYPSWQKIGKGLFINGITEYLYGVTPFEQETEVYEDILHPGVYRVNVYNSSALQEMNTLTINASNPDKVYLENNDFYAWEYEEWFTLGSPVPENKIYGYEDSGYGYIRDGVIRLGDLMKKGGNTDGETLFYPSMFQLALPGYPREPVYGMRYTYNGVVENQDGIFIQYSLSPYPDVENLRYLVYTGRLSYQEINYDVQPVFKSGGGNVIEFKPGQPAELLIPARQAGNYSVIFYCDAPSRDPEYYSRWVHYPVVETGDVPQPSITLSNVAPHNVFSEMMAQVHVDFPTSDGLVSVRAISTAAAAEEGLTEDNYYSYAMAAPGKAGASSFFSTVSGQDFSIVGLEPSTEYIIIAAGEDCFGNSAWTSATVTTAAAPEGWTELGTGQWQDYSFMANYGYVSNIKVMELPQKGRYRALAPYAEFWSALAESEPEVYAETYIGYSSDFDFYFLQDEGETYIYYAPYLNGRGEPGFYSPGSDTGCLDFFIYEIADTKPSQHPYMYYNAAIQEGVYNISPYVKIRGTNYFYDWRRLWEVVVMVMPGYSYTNPNAAEATPSSRNFVERQSGDHAPAVVAGEHKLKPFKRIPLSVGKVK